ncbi:MAG: tetratricopeptide repeat protein [Hyphomicrobium sp.]
MADDRDSLLREVDEELRREQLQKLWERYNGLILGGAALIVVAVAGYKFMETRRITAAQTAGAEFSKARTLEADKKAEDAQKAYEALAQSGPSGYAALAQLHLAKIHIDAGRTADALAIYETLAKNVSADGLVRGFAQLQAASLRLGEADFTEIKNRLTPLVSSDSAYKVSANELLGLAAFKAGNLAEARAYLEPLLIDPAASNAIQDRIKIVLGSVAQAELAATGTAAPVAAPAAAPATSNPAAAPAAATPNAAPAATAPPAAAPDSGQK